MGQPCAAVAAAAAAQPSTPAASHALMQSDGGVTHLAMVALPSRADTPSPSQRASQCGQYNAPSPKAPVPTEQHRHASFAALVDRLKTLMPFTRGNSEAAMAVQSALNGEVDATSLSAVIDKLEEMQQRSTKVGSTMELEAFATHKSQGPITGDRRRKAHSGASAFASALAAAWGCKSSRRHPLASIGTRTADPSPSAKAVNVADELIHAEISLDDSPQPDAPIDTTGSSSSTSGTAGELPPVNTSTGLLPSLAEPVAKFDATDSNALMVTAHGTSRAFASMGDEQAASAKPQHLSKSRPLSSPSPVACEDHQEDDSWTLPTHTPLGGEALRPLRSATWPKSFWSILASAADGKAFAEPALGTSGLTGTSLLPPLLARETMTSEVTNPLGDGAQAFEWPLARLLDFNIILAEAKLEGHLGQEQYAIEASSTTMSKGEPMPTPTHTILTFETSEDRLFDPGIECSPSCEDTAPTFASMVDDPLQDEWTYLRGTLPLKIFFPEPSIALKLPAPDGVSSQAWSSFLDAFGAMESGVVLYPPLAWQQELAPTMLMALRLTFAPHSFISSSQGALEGASCFSCYLVDNLVAVDSDVQLFQDQACKLEADAYTFPATRIIMGFRIHLGSRECFQCRKDQASTLGTA